MPRIESNMAQNVAAFTPAQGGIANAKRSEFARSTLASMQEVNNKKEVEVPRQVATKEESSFLGNVWWAVTLPFVAVGTAVSYVWTNVICCGWCSSDKAEVAADSAKVEKPKKAKEADDVDDVENDSDFDVEDSEDEVRFSSRTRYNNLEKAGRSGNLEKWDNAFDDASEATQKRLGHIARQVLVRAGAADVKPVSQLNLEDVQADLSPEDRQGLVKGIEARRETLSRAAAFRDDIAGITMVGKKKDAADDSKRKILGKFEKLADKSNGRNAQDLIVSVGMLAHGGRRSYTMKNDVVVTKPQNSRDGFARAAFDVEETVLPLDKAFKDMLSRVLNNDGYIFAPTKSGDRAREEIADFVAATDVADRELATHVRRAYQRMESQDARRLLATVVGNYFGSDGATVLSSTDMLPAEAAAIVHCARMIDRFENTGTLKPVVRFERDEDSAVHSARAGSSSRVVHLDAHSAASARAS